MGGPGCHLEAKKPREAVLYGDLLKYRSVLREAADEAIQFWYVRHCKVSTVTHTVTWVRQKNTANWSGAIQSGINAGNQSGENIAIQSGIAT